MHNNNKILRKYIGMLIKEALDKNVENEVLELMELPEYKSVESFTEFKFDNDEDTFSVAEAHAVARNIAQMNNEYEIAQVGQAFIEKVINELKTFGLKFIPLESIKSVRGVTSSKHGTNRYAGSGGGGSGFNNGGYLSLGGGPGAVGGGTKWDPKATTSLAMVPKRK